MCTRKNILQASSLTIYVICEPFVHTRECGRIAEVGVEPDSSFFSIRLVIPLLNIFRDCYIYTEFTPGYFSAILAGYLQYNFLTVFYVGIYHDF